jgi:hypothetical protein
MYLTRIYNKRTKDLRKMHYVLVRFQTNMNILYMF